MEAINLDLTFTTESQEDYPGERLPTLDFSMWIREEIIVQHTYYQKSMKPPFIPPEVPD